MEEYETIVRKIETGIESLKTQQDDFEITIIESIHDAIQKAVDVLNDQKPTRPLNKSLQSGLDFLSSKRGFDNDV